MENPIPTNARGWIYVLGIIIGALTAVVASVLAVLGLDAWQPVVTAVAAAVALISSTLGRSNLSAPEAAAIETLTDEAEV